MNIYASTSILTQYMGDLLKEFFPPSTEEIIENPASAVGTGTKFGSFLSIGYFIIYWVIKLMIAVASISFSTIIISLFIFVHCFFGIFLYGKDSIFDKFTKYFKCDIISMMISHHGCKI